MKRLLTLVVILIATIGSSQAQIFYKVSGNGLEKPSYILGTLHLAPNDYIEEIEGIDEAMESVEQCCWEVSLSEMIGKLAEIQQLPQKMNFLPEGISLRDLLTEEQAWQVDKLIKKTMGNEEDTDATIPLFGMDKLSPIGLFNTIQLLYITNNIPGYSPNQSMDVQLMLKAKAKSLEIVGLENVEDQLKIMDFSQMSYEEQVAELMMLVENWETFTTETNALVDAYYAHDIAGLTKIIEGAATSRVMSGPVDYDELFVNRNLRWMEKIPQMMSQKSTFFIMGAGHLVTESGMLNQLKKLGYTVESMEQ